MANQNPRLEQVLGADTLLAARVAENDAALIEIKRAFGIEPGSVGTAASVAVSSQITPEL